MSTVSENVTAIFTTLSSNISSGQPPLQTEVVVIFSIVWILIIILGSIGNGLVIYVMLQFGEKSVTNVYIVNLAFADLLFILCVVPATLVHTVVPSWILGNIVCKFSNYMIYVSIFLSTRIYFVFHLQCLWRKLYVFCISLSMLMEKALRILYFTYNVHWESFSYFVFHLQCSLRKLFVFCIFLIVFMGKALRILYFTYNVYGESFTYFVFHLQCLCRKLFVFCISLLVFLGKAFRILYLRW